MDRHLTAGTDTDNDRGTSLMANELHHRSAIETDRLPLEGPHLITGLGTALGLVLIVEGVFVIMSGLSFPDGYRPGVSISLVFIAGLVLGGSWIEESDISPGQYDRIGLWSLVGALGVSVFITWIVVSSQQLSAVLLVSTVRWAASMGGGIGFLMGMFDARRIDQAFETARAQLRRQATERQRDQLEEFASIVSHDLRNPLTVATGQLELARKTGDCEHLDAAETALERMDAIIEDTLALARQGRTVGETEAVDFADMVYTSWEAVATETAELQFDGDGTLIADRNRLNHVFENLFRNAIEHGGEAVTISVGRLSNGEGWYVEDDGPGIPPDDRQNVFDAGYTTETEGSGLGLAIVKRIVEAHGWSIRVLEGAAGGARFEIRDVE